MKYFPFIRSLPSAIAGTLVIAAPLLILSLSPLTGIYAVMIVLFLLPAALCTAGMICGLAPMIAGAAAGLFSMYHLAGSAGLTLSAIYVLPIAAAFVLIIAFKVPFKQAAPAMIGVHIAALAAVYLMLQQMTGHDLYTVAGDAAVAALQDWELGDTMLYQFYMMGMITLPESLAENMLLPMGEESYMLSDAARADLLLSMRTFISSALASLIPSLIASQSLLGGLGCLYPPIRFGYIAAERRAFKGDGVIGYIPGTDGKNKLDFPTLGMPPLSLWHLPRGVGLQVGIALAAGYLLQQSVSPAPAIAGIILYSAASTIYVIQGIALVNFMQKAKGTKRIWRVVIPALLLTLSVLSYVGIFDQITNIRRLRKPREPKEE